jgi:nucleotide-binding universal stress UspA family protein
MDAEMRLALKNILVLTDFSEASETAIPFAISIARNYEAKLYTLHVLTPFPFAYAVAESTMATIEKSEEAARAGMQRLAAQLVGVPHEVMIVRGESVWSALESVLGDYAMDLVTLGTHGRTGALKFLLGSVVEEIFGRASAGADDWSVGTKGRTRCGAVTTCPFRHRFRATYANGLPYAISMAQENQATLLLLHVMRDPASRTREKTPQDSAANVMHQLYELVPQDAKLWSRPQLTIRFGDPAERTLEVAEEHDADLIVLGIRRTASYLGVATPPVRATAHKVVVHAECPVLTVRG